MKHTKWIVRMACCLVAMLSWGTAMADRETSLLFVSKNLTDVAEDSVATQLAKTYRVEMEDQANLAEVQLDDFDAIVISESVDADNEAVLNLIRSGRKPMLNMKGFTYGAGRLGWGEPNSGSVTDNGRMLYIERTDHPIFQTCFADKAQGEPIEVLSETEGRGLMPIHVTLQGSYCLAIAFTQDIEEFDADAAPQTVLHEIPAVMRGGNKYICLPLSRSSHPYLTEDGRTLINGIMAYLLDDETEDIDLPDLQINRFAVEGIDADINQADNTIELTLTDTQYEAMDSLRAVIPDIELADPEFTHLIPAADSEMDLRFAIFRPLTLVLTDYISQRVYTFSIRLQRQQGIDQTETDSEEITIYDIFGRKTGSDKAALPQGIYIVVKANGESYKMMR